MTSIKLNVGDRLSSLIKDIEYDISYDQTTTIESFLNEFQTKTGNKINVIHLNFLYIRQWKDGELSDEDLLNKDIDRSSLIINFIKGETDKIVFKVDFDDKKVFEFNYRRPDRIEPENKPEDKPEDLPVSKDSNMSFLKKYEISHYDFIKSDIEYELKEQTDNMFKYIYKIAVYNGLYNTLKKKGFIEDGTNPITRQFSEITDTLIRDYINVINKNFIKDVISGSFEHLYNENLLNDDIVSKIKNSYKDINDSGKPSESTGIPLRLDTGRTMDGIDAADPHPELTSRPGVMVGGNKVDFRYVKDLLEILGEPKHDFGKGKGSRSAKISHKINSNYNGDVSGERITGVKVKEKLNPSRGIFSKFWGNKINFENLLGDKHESKLFHTLSKIKKYHMDIDTDSPKGKLTQLHTFFNFYKFINDGSFRESKVNQAGQLSEMIFPESFKKVFKAKMSLLDIKHFVYDTGAGIDFLGSTGGIKDELKKESEGLSGEKLDPINYIVPLVNIWDPGTASINNFNCDLIKASTEGDYEFMKLLRTTYIEENTKNCSDIWFPKRSSISGYYSVKYNEDHILNCTNKPSKSPPMSIYIKYFNEELTDSTLPERYEKIDLLNGWSVDNLSRAMQCIVDENGNTTNLAAVTRTTKTLTTLDTGNLKKMVEALMRIEFNDYVEYKRTHNCEGEDITDDENSEITFKSGSDTELTEDSKNKLRIRILLDMKKSGDWSQVKWVRKINSSFPKKHKSMFISGDKLCALLAILNGIPTIFGSTGREKFESGQEVEAKLLAFYAGSASKLTIDEISQFEIFIKNQLGEDFFDLENNLKPYSDIIDNLKAKFGILNSEAYTTSIEVILNNSEDTDSKKPDYLLYKLTKENTPDISDPSDELKKLSINELLFSDENNKLLRKHWKDILDFKIVLEDETGVDGGDKYRNNEEKSAYIDGQEPNILNKIGIVKGIISVIISSSDFIQTEYSDILKSTTNIVKCINLVNSDVIYGDSSGGTGSAISKPHIDKINELCSISMEYAPESRDNPVQRRRLLEDIETYNNEFTMKFKVHLENLIGGPVQNIESVDLSDIINPSNCDDIYGKGSRDWWRQSSKVVTIISNLSSILSKTLQVSSLQHIFSRTVALFNNIIGILEDVNLFGSTIESTDNDETWIKNLMLSSIELQYYKILGSERTMPCESKDEALQEDKILENIETGLTQIITNLECLLIAMDKYSNEIMNSISGLDHEKNEVIEKLRNTIETSSSTFSEMFTMLSDIKKRGFITLVAAARLLEDEGDDVGEDIGLDDSHLTIINELDTLEEDLKVEDLTPVDINIDQSKEDLIEQTVTPPVLEQSTKSIKVLEFEDESKSKFKRYNGIKVNVIKEPISTRGLYTVEINEGDDIGKKLVILQRYVKDVPEESAATAQAAPLVESAPLVEGETTQAETTVEVVEDIEPVAVRTRSHI